MTGLTRRSLIAAGAAAIAAPRLAMAEALTADGVDRTEADSPRNVSAFSMPDWRDHFSALGVGAILADTKARALHFWSGDGQTYRLFPTSVPISEELTRRGYTEIVRKRIGPDWTPTASQRERFGWTYMPPGPDNPLGTHAMYLSWPAYLIHGTHDTRKIGRPSSDGCIGLYNENIAELFEITPVGTQVRLI